jgi:AcrR family transcriptional regulator
VRERLLDAALLVLRESGIQQLTQVQVARRAGVRQSHLTYYFPTRGDLLEAVTKRAVEGIAAGLGPALSDDATQSHARLLERLARAVADLEHMRIFVATIVEADGDPAVRRVMRRATEMMEATLAEALGGDHAGERARLVLAAVWGLGLYHFLMRPGSAADPTRAYLSWLAAASTRRGVGSARIT